MVQIKNLEMKFSEEKGDEAVNSKIVRVFPVNVIASMSSGKSTLINALLGKELIPSKNEACTATITEILDNDTDKFSAVTYDMNDIIFQKIPELTYEVMSKLNDDERVYKISATGNIPFFDDKSIALMLVDTLISGGLKKQVYNNMIYRAINSDSNNLILYVMNGTQLSTNDDASLLEYVAKQIKEGGKQIRDRFIFVVNKMDGFNPEEENIERTIKAARSYLASYGIDDPQIFPCSAYTALNIRTYLADIDIDNLTRADEKKLPSAARDTLPMIDKFIEYESMHLEQYSTLSPIAQRELDLRLRQAEEKGDMKEQALIHCGIYSIEAAIKSYIKEYVNT